MIWTERYQDGFRGVFLGALWFEPVARGTCNAGTTCGQSHRDLWCLLKQRSGVLVTSALDCDGITMTIQMTYSRV